MQATIFAPELVIKVQKAVRKSATQCKSCPPSIPPFPCPPPPPQVCYPKRTDRPLYHGLVTQCESLAIQFISMEDLQQQCQQQQQQQQQQEDGAAGGGLSAVCDVVIDALFGFSFKGTPRPPFDTLLKVGCPSIPICLSPCLTGCCSNTASHTSQTPSHIGSNLIITLLYVT